MTKKKSGMYKNLTNYGDSEFSIFLRKAFIKGMGYSEEMLNKPIIGITNTYSDYNPCHGNVPDLIKSVKAGILSSGAIPLEFPTISIHESFAYPTSMYLRNLMSIDTEEMIKAQPMDACVLIDLINARINCMDTVCMKMRVDKCTRFSPANKVMHLRCTRITCVISPMGCLKYFHQLIAVISRSHSPQRMGILWPLKIFGILRLSLG